ncbi:hypothetical protein [Ornithinimicrobium kibberense]|uniref:hypothetical protein n=1 Tax=Ornithinimicrobium kibberense TaxID=282060 RepID=UPI00360A11F9
MVQEAAGGAARKTVDVGLGRPEQDHDRVEVPVGAGPGGSAGTDLLGPDARQSGGVPQGPKDVLGRAGRVGVDDLPSCRQDVTHPHHRVEVGVQVGQRRPSDVAVAQHRREDLVGRPLTPGRQLLAPQPAPEPA